MNYVLIILLTILPIYSHGKIIESGTTSLTRIMPHWTSVEAFGEFSEANQELTRTFTFSSTTATTINSSPVILGSSNFSIVPNGSSECKTGFVFSTSNVCTIKVKFSVNHSGSSDYSANLNWLGFSIPLTAKVSLKIPRYIITDYNGFEINEINHNTLFET